MGAAHRTESTYSRAADTRRVASSGSRHEGIKGLLMRLIAILPVRNEDWCLGLSLRAMLMFCDEVIVGLHACTDASAKIVADVLFEEPGRITWTEHRDPIWSEMAHRQALLDIARERGATHIAIVDA